MGRVRSPSYPRYSLEDAIKNAEIVFNQERANPVDRGVVAKHIGYSGLNGAADKSLSTMMQFGMFEKVAKGEIKISQLAIDILHPEHPEQRANALSKSAMSPPLFRALQEQFPSGMPSQESLKSYLLRNQFNDRAIGPIILAYTKTNGYLEQQNVNLFDDQLASRGFSNAIPSEGSADYSDEPQHSNEVKVESIEQSKNPHNTLTPSQPEQIYTVPQYVEQSAESAPKSEQLELGSTILKARMTAGHAVDEIENDWMRYKVGAESTVRIITKGKIGPKEIGNLIKLLQVQMEVLE